MSKITNILIFTSIGLGFCGLFVYTYYTYNSNSNSNKPEPNIEERVRQTGLQNGWSKEKIEQTIKDFYRKKAKYLNQPISQDSKYSSSVDSTSSGGSKRKRRSKVKISKNVKSLKKK